MPVFQLNDDLVFPDPRLADPSGLLAVGGDLSVKRLLLAYRLGIFPWYGEGEPILWWSPDPRCILFPQAVHVSRRLERVLRQNIFQLTFNQAFDRVIDSCAQVRIDQGQETWLVPEMRQAYRQLHVLGYAHSIEAWAGDSLAGGMYGVTMGPFFFGESMFHLRTNASKVILARLCRYLTANGFELIDCQVPNKHLISMGASNIPRQEFLSRLCRTEGAKQGCWAPATFPDRFD